MVSQCVVSGAPAARLVYSPVICFHFKVDAIVNSIGEHLNLQVGALSKAVLAKAGPLIQTGLRTAALAKKPEAGKAKAGDVLITTGYDLPCRYVIHAVCVKYSNTAIAVISTRISHTLWEYAKRWEPLCGTECVSVPNSAAVPRSGNYPELS